MKKQKGSGSFYETPCIGTKTSARQKNAVVFFV